ncbi:MAG: HAD-IIA family hydrolase [Atribacterota bacterium]
MRDWKNFVLDLDGVLYLLNQPIPGGQEFVDFLRTHRYNVAFLSNNTFLTRKEYVEKLERMGISAFPEEVLTSAFAVAKFLGETRPGARVYVIGEEGLKKELKSCGLHLVSKGEADFVVAGMDRKFNFRKMSRAFRYIQGGAEFIGTNPDPTYPTDNGLLPGAGAIIAGIEVCSGKKARVFGKPSPLILNLLLETRGFRKEETVIVGDRLDTDIALGVGCGVFSVLVLTGVTSREDVEVSQVKPDLVVENLFELRGMLARGEKE